VEEEVMEVDDDGEEEEVVEAPAPAAKAAAKAPAAKAAAKATKTKAAPAEEKPPPPPAATNIVFVLSALAVVVSLAWVVLVPPGGGKVARPTKASVAASYLGPKAFTGTSLKMSGGFRGSALVSFTDKSCPVCIELTPVLDSLAAKLASGSPPLAGQLKVAQVDCVKNVALCSSFGVSGDEPDASGYPTMLWFRDGAVQGSYPNGADEDGLTEAAIIAWAAAKAEAGELVAI